MAVLDDHWPPLAHIRTSSMTSRVGCETFSPNQQHSPSSPGDPPPLSPAHKPSDPREPPPKSPDFSPRSTVSPPSTASSTNMGFSARFFSCFPPRAASEALSKFAATSPGKERRRGASEAASMVRSFLGFSGSIQQSGPIGHSGAIPHSGPLSGQLKGYSAASKGHAANAFTMIPPDVVGKKKPPGYESDEPTSPEVTCLGRVRRKKHSTAWDALIKEKRRTTRKHMKRHFESPRKSDFMQSPRKEKLMESPSKAKPSTRWKHPSGDATESQMADSHRKSDAENDNERADLGRFGSVCESSASVDQSSRKAKPSRWKHMLGMRDTTESQTAEVDRKSKVENAQAQEYIDLNRFSSACSSDCDSGPLSPPNTELPPKNNGDAAVDSGTDFASPAPPPDCLLRMRNSGRSKGRHTFDELQVPASESLPSTEESAVADLHYRDSDA